MPQVEMHSAAGNSVLHAETLSSMFAPEGWITTVKADRNLQGNSPEGYLSAQTGELEMYPRVNEAKLLTLRGNVRMDSRDAKTGATRSLRTNSMQLNFDGGLPGKPSRIRHGGDSGTRHYGLD